MHDGDDATLQTSNMAIILQLNHSIFDSYTILHILHYHRTKHFKMKCKNITNEIGLYPSSKTGPT